MSSLAQVLGRLPSGLFVLTSRHGELETGMLASWVMQAGFHPPMITVCVRHERYVGDWLTAGSPFAINILSEGHKKLVAHFSRGFEPGQDAFKSLEIERSAAGVPVLRDALGYLECRRVSHLDSGDHRIYLAEAISGQLRGDAPPLVHIRKSGLHY
jgi:flavin reductase (DIM6/NTAB) family NADH-FMN oxidoreductase RutF